MTQLEILKDALENLVQLKDWKDKYGKDEHYEKHQPLAWEKAREALKMQEGEENDLEEKVKALEEENKKMAAILYPNGMNF